MNKLKQLFINNTFNIEDISYLSKLLDTKLPLKDCLKLISNSKNQNIINDIINKLESGQLIEKIIENNLPKKIKPYVLSLLKSLSFSQSLSISIQFHDEYLSNQNKILSKIAYPLILLFLSISAMYLFDLYGIDTIFNLLASFDVKRELYSGIRLIFRIIINIIYYLFILLVILVLYYSRPKKIVIFYILISKFAPDSLMSLYLSQEFISLFLICISKGFKTKESLNLLKNMKHKPLISFLAYHLDDSLLQGESMIEAVNKNYYDSSLKRFIKIANYTNDFEGILNTYIDVVKRKIEYRIKKYTLTLQMLTYSFIGLIIIFIYQLLFIPMQAINLY